MISLYRVDMNGEYSACAWARNKKEAIRIVVKEYEQYVTFKEYYEDPNVEVTHVPIVMDRPDTPRIEEDENIQRYAGVFFEEDL